ncbi:HIT family protein [Tannockella kyphosi]|uniref:HIT family protein n=1 Tax=Tannockella kyphosi TaxID=2899121 RepID=UPI00201282B3|nr:HIT family protein [Tannockella kyphosi]
MSNCIFCKIANHEIPGKIIYEDDKCIAFLDLSQVTNGHTLVIPKTHAANFLEVDDEVLTHMTLVTKALANKIKDALQASGINILTNAGEIAGQTVMHFHFHIIPRFNENDGFIVNFEKRLDDIDLDDLLNKLK